MFPSFDLSVYSSFYDLAHVLQDICSCERVCDWACVCVCMCRCVSQSMWQGSCIFLMEFCLQSFLSFFWEHSYTMNKWQRSVFIQINPNRGLFHEAILPNKPGFFFSVSPTPFPVNAQVQHSSSSITLATSVGTLTWSGVRVNCQAKSQLLLNQSSWNTDPTERRWFYHWLASVLPYYLILYLIKVYRKST